MTATAAKPAVPEPIENLAFSLLRQSREAARTAMALGVPPTMALETELAYDRLERQFERVLGHLYNLRNPPAKLPPVVRIGTAN